MKEDIIRMARECEFHVIGQRVFSPVIEGADIVWLLERFADLVAEAEREACAQLCEQDGLLWGKRYAASIRARGNT